MRFGQFLANFSRSQLLLSHLVHDQGGMVALIAAGSFSLNFGSFDGSLGLFNHPLGLLDLALCLPDERQKGLRFFNHFQGL